MNLPILLDPHHRRSCNANPTPCVDYHSNWCEANARQKHLVLSASVTLVLLDPSQQDRYEIAELALHLQRPVVRTEKQVSATTIELRMDQLNKLKHATWAAWFSISASLGRIGSPSSGGEWSIISSALCFNLQRTKWDCTSWRTKEWELKQKSNYQQILVFVNKMQKLITKITEYNRTETKALNMTGYNLLLT